MTSMDHDRNFKELLSNFFVEFVDLFLPDISTALDRDVAIVPMDKEIFTDVTLGEQPEVECGDGTGRRQVPRRRPGLGLEPGAPGQAGLGGGVRRDR